MRGLLPHENTQAATSSLLFTGGSQYRGRMDAGLVVGWLPAPEAQLGLVPLQGAPVAGGPPERRALTAPCLVLEMLTWLPGPGGLTLPAPLL